MKFILSIFIFLSITSCATTKSTDFVCDGTTATMKNYLGLDGCGWVLVLENGNKLEPVNLDKFGIELKEDKKVCIHYHELDFSSICMVGPIIELDSMTE